LTRSLREDFAGMSVLGVGCFYAFLAQRRGAERVVAVDDEQYRLWVASRWGGVELEGGPRRPSPAQLGR
jgi:threonine dehydrogenase-like Zn-dependent dehydrogenase